LNLNYYYYYLCFLFLFVYVFIYLFIVYLATQSTEFERLVLTSLNIFCFVFIFCTFLVYFSSLLAQLLVLMATVSFVISCMSILLAQYAGHGAAVSRTEGGSIILNTRYLFS